MSGADEPAAARALASAHGAGSARALASAHGAGSARALAPPSRGNASGVREKSADLPGAAVAATGAVPSGDPSATPASETVTLPEELQEFEEALQADDLCAEAGWFAGNVPRLTPEQGMLLLLRLGPADPPVDAFIRAMYLEKREPRIAALLALRTELGDLQASLTLTAERKFSPADAARALTILNRRRKLNPRNGAHAYLAAMIRARMGETQAVLEPLLLEAFNAPSFVTRPDQAFRALYARGLESAAYHRFAEKVASEGYDVEVLPDNRQTIRRIIQSSEDPKFAESALRFGRLVMQEAVQALPVNHQITELMANFDAGFKIAYTAWQKANPGSPLPEDLREPFSFYKMDARKSPTDLGPARLLKSGRPDCDPRPYEVWFTEMKARHFAPEN